MKKILWAVMMLSSLTCWGTIYLTVSGANVKRAKIALGQVHPMGEAVASEAQLARNIREQLKSDLLFSNLFDFINEADFAKFDPPSDYNKILYESFSQVGAAFALKLAYQVNGTRLVVEAHLYDVPGQKNIFSKKYQGTTAQYYRVVHAVSEDVLAELTGERGLFNSRILMTCWKYPYTSPPPKEIYVVDPDGRNLTQLTLDRTLSTTPTWMQDGKNITYSQYEWVKRNGLRTRGVVLKKHDLTTGKRTSLSEKEGMNSGATWNANAKSGVATLSFTGRPELYYIDRDGGVEPEPLSRSIQWKRLVGDGFQSSQASLLFDVEASWSPDGKKLVFSSARTGHPMIYVLDIATKIANQLTFAGQYNASPSWSPRGDKILFAAQRTGEGNFDIYMIDPDGNNLTRMTAGESRPRRINSENPSWAPTGRHFAFANNEEGHYSIYVMTVDSAQKVKISPPDKECFTPSWGPYEGS